MQILLWQLPHGITDPIWIYRRVVIMSLDKAIEHGKEHREQYRGSKRYVSSCRNHGRCSYCVNQRTKKFLAKKEAAIEEIREYKKFDE